MWVVRARDWDTGSSRGGPFPGCTLLDMFVPNTLRA